MNGAKKDTIYIDVEDDITAVVEKISSAPTKIVALVLPKRATVFQSVVNMKLLKRSADDAGKRLVLITSENSILSLAGLTGIHVAKTLQTKPYLPPVPAAANKQFAINDDGVPISGEQEIDKSKSVGELAGTEPDTIELDDIEPAEPANKTAAKLNKKLKIPNFEKFRTKLILAGVALILLIIGFYYANFIAPSAKINIVADTQTVESNLELTANLETKEPDLEKNIVPAAQKDIRKTDSEKAPATGKKDVGDRAKGTLTLTNCINDGEKHTLPAGTIFSSEGLNFATAEAVTLEPAIFSGNNCREDLYESLGYTETVGVAATQAGDKYNLDARAYASSVAGILAEGSEMTGGTSKIITVVSQSDIDSAKQKLQDRLNAAVRQELLQHFQSESYIGLVDTFKQGEAAIGTTPNVDTEAAEVTVTFTATYSMLGVPIKDLEAFINNDVKDDIDTSKQGVTDFGLDNAVIRLVDRTPGGGARISLRTLVTAGPAIDEAALKQEIAGKKRGETQAILNSYPGVRDVTIDYSPFWVFSTPKRVNKIHITLQQPEGIPTETTEDNGQ